MTSKKLNALHQLADHLIMVESYNTVNSEIKGAVDSTNKLLSEFKQKQKLKADSNKK